jgi:hypothetical protein
MGHLVFHIRRGQKLAKASLGAVQRHADRADSDLQLSRDFQVAHFVQVPQAKHVSFLRRQLSDGGSQALCAILGIELLERIG